MAPPGQLDTAGPIGSPGLDAANSNSLQASTARQNPLFYTSLHSGCHSYGSVFLCGQGCKSKFARPTASLLGELRSGIQPNSSSRSASTFNVLEKI